MTSHPTYGIGPGHHVLLGDEVTDRVGGESLGRVVVLTTNMVGFRDSQERWHQRLAEDLCLVKRGDES